MIQLDNVTKLYGQHIAVRDLDLSVREGEIMGLIGQNGAGKSTTLKMIAGLMKPSNGTVRVMGRDMSTPAGARYVKQRLGYLPEESALYGNMQILDYLVFFGRLYGLPPGDVAQRAQTLLEALDLPATDKLIADLSKGMRRKVAIARTLLHDPTLLILDEPNSGLDPLTAAFIIRYLRSLAAAGKTILLSAHNLFHIETICDRVTIIKDGQVMISDTMNAIRSRMGRRAYEITFQSPEALDFPIEHGDYVFRTGDIAAFTTMLTTIEARQWTLVQVRTMESALEEIYVDLVTPPANQPQP